MLPTPIVDLLDRRLQPHLDQTQNSPVVNEPARELRIRRVVRPDKAQAMLLDRLGLRLPERLRLPPRIAEM